MRSAELHPDEERRLATLAALGVLDTPAEERFDRIARLAAMIMDTPIALISLVDRDRQWFKARVGLEVQETGRDVAFCAHAIVGEGDEFVVEDATLDERFADNPLVTEDPSIRFYAGHVVRDAGGLPLGTLCAIDRRPRPRSAEQMRSLQLLAEMVEAEFRREAERDVLVALAESEAQNRQIMESLRRSEQMAATSLDSLEQGVILAGRSAEVRRMNPAAERILGYDAAGLEQRWASPDWVAYDEHGAVIPSDQRPIRRAVTTGEPVVGEIVGWPRPDGTRIIVRLSVIPNATDEGDLVIAFTDVTEEHRARRLLDVTLEIAPVGLAVLDDARRILRCNRTFARHAGRDRADLVGVDALALLHPDDHQHAAENGRLLQRGLADTAVLAHRVQRDDGDEVWVETHLAVIPDPDMPLAIAATHDVTEHRRMTRELSMFGHLFEHANDLVTVIDTAGVARFTSPSAYRLLGLPEGHHVEAGVLSLIHPDDLPIAADRLQQAVAGADKVDPFTVRVRTSDGGWRHLECVAVNLLDAPAVEGIVVTARDATERVLLNELLAHRATHDALTDLPNRNVLDEVVHAGLAHAAQTRDALSVCFIDLDGFKAVNDTLGHAAGDRLLIDVADRLRAVVRPQDTVLRLGGDEFVVVLDGVTSRDEAHRIATRLRDAVTALEQPEGLRIGASIGLTLSRDDDTTSDLLNRADLALYRAKPYHDSRIEVYEDAGSRTA